MAEPAHGAEAASIGMPQLDFATFPSQIFWLIVAMVTLYFILSRIALPRIASAIEERHDAIEEDLDRAAEFRRRALQAEKDYDAALAAAKAKAQEIAAAARAEVQKVLDAQIAKADAEIAARAAESEKRIGEIRDNALANVEVVAQEAAAALVEAFTPGAAASGAVRAAVAARLQH
ncbi:MAG: ATP F0F1 synthase subunit B' [Alphaproteobacteria bacterium HGW-Alphaproteobacteria-8]|nr:MAG: ATP F0F1 synthase subunit B' [Alphaproteobacteria bacterium HGW-Alphaproteobacteria-8]